MTRSRTFYAIFLVLLSAAIIAAAILVAPVFIAFSSALLS